MSEEKKYYCPEHKYNPPANSGWCFCPKCEIEAAKAMKEGRGGDVEFRIIQLGPAELPCRKDYQWEDDPWLTGTIEHPYDILPPIEEEREES